MDVQIGQQHRTALHKLCEWLADSNVNWVLTGSMAFALQGLPVTPDDIDVQTDEAGAYAIERLFAEDVVQPVAFSGTQRIRSHFGVLRIAGVVVEIMGDVEKRLADGRWQAAPNLNQHKRFVAVDGMAVPVLSLAYEAEAYRLMGRVETVDILQSWINQSCR